MHFIQSQRLDIDELRKRDKGLRGQGLSVRFSLLILNWSPSMEQNHPAGAQKLVNSALQSAFKNAASKSIALGRNLTFLEPAVAG
jgi:hypothetical protein